MNPEVDTYIEASDRWPEEMNDFLALMFFKGALLEDREGVLEGPPGPVIPTAITPPHR